MMRIRPIFALVAALVLNSTANAGPAGSDPSSAMANGITRGMIGAAAGTAVLSQPRETYDSSVNAETSRANVQTYSSSTNSSSSTGYERSFSSSTSTPRQ